MRYRLYPAKDTTIVEGTYWNAGTNEVTELWYGTRGVTRHLVQFDLSSWISKVSGKTAPDLSECTCYLHMKNCYPTIEEVYDVDYLVPDQKASSVDIEVLSATTAWDEGDGFDIVKTNGTIGYANWYSATTITPWSTAGGDYGLAIFSAHVDHGFENLSGNVLSIVNAWCGGTITNNGLVIKYTDTIEALTATTKSVLKFHNRETHTYKKPYLEFNWDGQVRDESDDITYGSTKKIYLVTRNHNTPTSVNSVDSLVISFDDSTYTGLTSTTIVNQYPGIYYVEVAAPSYDTGSTAQTFTGTWTLTYESGSQPSTVTFTGSLDSSDNAWSVDQSDVFDTSLISVQMPSLKEEYKTDESVYIEVNAVSAYTSNNVLMKSLEYRLDLVDGDNTFEMVGWEGVSYTRYENFIMLDMSWMIPDNKYRLRFRYSGTDHRLLEQDTIKEFWVRSA